MVTFSVVTTQSQEAQLPGGDFGRGFQEERLVGTHFLEDHFLDRRLATPIHFPKFFKSMVKSWESKDSDYLLEPMSTTEGLLWALRDAA